MGQVRNDFGEVRVMPTLDYSGVEPDRVLDIPDEDVYHWVAGGWTALTRYPVPYRLYANHAHDPNAYALPAPKPEKLSAIAVGAPEAAVAPPAPQTPAPAPAPAAAPPAPAPAQAAAAPAGIDAKE
jgi:hypothetical protein